MYQQQHAALKQAFKDMSAEREQAFTMLGERKEMDAQRVHEMRQMQLLKGNTFAGTAFISYGAFWMGWFMLEFLSKIDHSLPVSLTGKTLWCALWGILTAGFFVVTLRKNFGLMFIFSTLTVTFFLLAGGVYNPNSQKAAGYVGFACGSSAIYTALAMLYQDELGITLPGIGPVHFI
ncbi:hypothetical protein FOA52_006293 [Chlamydomonas sp. UWO 241]|nr:hypothetical protein FOA52_006293 [Chlamydomonas sp. UWO 241]